MIQTSEHPYVKPAARKTFQGRFAGLFRRDIWSRWNEPPEGEGSATKKITILSFVTNLLDEYNRVFFNAFSSCNVFLKTENGYIRLTVSAVVKEIRCVGKKSIRLGLVDSCDTNVERVIIHRKMSILQGALFLINLQNKIAT